MTQRKPLVILACLLAAALIPSVLAEGFSVGPGWTFANTATTPTPTPSTFSTPTPTPFDSTNPTPNVTANPTTTTETTQPTTNPTEQPTPTPTVPELGGAAIFGVMAILLASALIIKHRRNKQ